jgi:5-methylthioadenosine/S-adenosylhomocysteine deaminase
MLVSADWVVPVASPPIRDGAVLVAGTRIAAVGPRAELAAASPGAHCEHFGGCVITPGLVNAHTHLTLSALGGVVPPLPFAQWLPRLVAALKPWDIGDHEASGVVGAEACLSSGVTVVGDIAYGAAEVASASAAGLGGVYYWELLGMYADQVPQALEELRYPARSDQYGDRVKCGLSPHSPYTAGPGLLQAVHQLARDLDVPCAVHLAESDAELELLRSGTGPLAATADRTARGFTPPGTTPVEYLASLGVLRHVTAVHVCHATDDDIGLLATHARGGVTCPRSNRYLGNPPPSVAALLKAGLAVGVGTDSWASNNDLDLMAEIRTIQAAEKHLTAATLLHLATAGGARAIGVDDRYGSLEPGKFADLVAFRVDGGAEPEAAVVDTAGSETLSAVMTGGVWRARDGVLLVRNAAAAARAREAHDRSLEALAVP